MNTTQFAPSGTRIVMRNMVMALIATVVLNLVVYFIGESAGWIPDSLPSGAETFGIPAIIASTVGPIVLGGVLLAILVHTTTHPVRMFALIAAVVFIATLFAPLSVAGASTAFRSFLVALHVITALVGTILLIWGIEDEEQHY